MLTEIFMNSFKFCRLFEWSPDILSCSHRRVHPTTPSHWVQRGRTLTTHKAAVIGDPRKDASGPSLNILIKLMAVESLVFAPFFAAHGGLIFK